MKRSEMEIYLEQNLIELRGYQEDNAEIVAILLFAIEEAGMLPPLRVPELTKWGEPNTIGEHTWEPEDD